MQGVDHTDDYRVVIGDAASVKRLITNRTTNACCCLWVVTRYLAGNQGKPSKILIQIENC